MPQFNYAVFVDSEKSDVCIYSIINSPGGIISFNDFSPCSCKFLFRSSSDNSRDFFLYVFEHLNDILLGKDKDARVADMIVEYDFSLTVYITPGKNSFFNPDYWLEFTMQAKGDDNYSLPCCSFTAVVSDKNGDPSEKYYFEIISDKEIKIIENDGRMLLFDKDSYPKIKIVDRY